MIPHRPADMSSNTGGYGGAAETLARRYGMNGDDTRRMGPKVMLKLARFAKTQEKLEGTAPRGRAEGYVGGAVNVG